MADPKFFGIAALIAGAVLSGGTLIGAILPGSTAAIALWGASIGFGTLGAIVGAREARKAANASLQDRITTIRSTDEPRAILYGRGRTGGVLLYASPPYGPKLEKQFMVIGLVGHPCDAIEQLWADNEQLALDPDGYVAGTSTGKWRSRVIDFRAVTHDAFAVWSASLPNDNLLPAPAGATGILSVSYVPAAGEVSRIAVQGVDYDIVPGTLTVRSLTMTSGNGAQLTITYSGRFTLDGYIRVWRYTGREVGDARRIDAAVEAGIDLVAPGHIDRETATFDGICRLDIEMSYDPTVFADGVPNFSATVRGMRLYDPRKDSTVPGGSGSHRFADPSTWEWSRLAALATAHYVTTEWGFNTGGARMDWPSVMTSADRCAVQIQVHPTDTTFTDYQFTVDGFLSTGSALGDNLDELTFAMDGFASPVGAQWRIVAGGWVPPAADAILTDADVTSRSDLELFAFAEVGDLYNCVRARYRDEATFEVTDMPPYRSDDGAGGGYVNVDGFEAWRDFDLPLTINPFRSGRLVRQMLHRHRAALGMSASFSLAAWRYQVGDRVRLRLTEYGWDTLVQDGGTGKVFMVIDRHWIVPDEVRLVVVEDGAALYSASHSEFAVPDPTPQTVLPSAGSVSAPTGFAASASAADFVVAGDGTRIGFVRFTWDAITDGSVLGGGWLELLVKRTIDSTFEVVRVSPFDTEYRHHGVRADDTLNAGLRAVNAAFAKSDVTKVLGNVPELGSLPGTFRVSNAFSVQEGSTIWSGNLLQNASLQFGTEGWSLFPFVTPAYVVRATQDMPTVQRLVGPPAWNVMVEEQGAGAVAATATVTAWAPDKLTSCAPGERWGAAADFELDGCDAVLGIAFYRSDGSFIPGAVTLSDPVSKGYIGASLIANYVRRTVYGTAPEGAAGVRLLAYKRGTKSPAVTSRMWVAQPDLRLIVGADAMPPWGVGAQGVVPTAGLASRAVMDVYTAVDKSAAFGSSSAAATCVMEGPTFTVPEAGELEVVCTFSYNFTGPSANHVLFVGTVTPPTRAPKTLISDGPVVANVAANTTQVDTRELTENAVVAKGQVVTCRLTIARVAATSVSGSGVVEKSVGSSVFSANDRVYNGNWKVTLRKR